MTSSVSKANLPARDFSLLWDFLIQLLSTLNRISSRFSPATHARFVQQALHRRLWVKTVGTLRSFFLHFSHRGFGVTPILTHFFLQFSLSPRTYAGSPVALWLGLHAGASRLYIPPNYTAPYLTTQLPSLTVVRSCFHISSVLLSRSTCYSHTIPSIPPSCNNVLSV